MHAITMTAPGGPEVLRWSAVPDARPGPGEVLVKVAAAGVNRADLLQRAGGYPPPAGASDILGLECSGTVAQLGEDVTGFRVGDQVCALLAGGGYAEYVAVPQHQLLPIPRGVSLVDAAGLPEVACTVWSNLVMTVGLHSGQRLLAHGGSSGIGTMAIQVGRALGCQVLVTASTAAKLELCDELGADVLIDYTSDDFVERVREATDDHGADAVLDVVGGTYLARNIAALADGGRIVTIGLLGGGRAEIDLSALMAKRAGVVGTMLRSRPATGPGSKAEVVQDVRARLWPLIERGDVRPVIGARLPMTEAAEAHRRLRAGDVTGKIVLTVEPEDSSATV